MRRLVGRLLARPFARFLLVGGLNTALCYAVYALLILAGLPFWAANLLALLFGIGWSYVTLGRFVHGHRGAGRLPRFVLSWVAVYAVQTGCIALLMRLGLGPTLAGLVVLPGAAIASYLIQRHLVFRRAPGG